MNFISLSKQTKKDNYQKKIRLTSKNYVKVYTKYSKV